MELLKLALFVILLTTISAKPTRRDTDSLKKDKSLVGIHGKQHMSSSKQSSESSSSEDSSSESSEEIMFTNKPAVVQTTFSTTAITSGDESKPTPEPGTHRPTMMDTTPAPVTVSNFTEEASTPASVTQIRGDM